MKTESTESTELPPERIWIDFTANNPTRWWLQKSKESDVEYTRAVLPTPSVDDARRDGFNAGLREAAEECDALATILLADTSTAPDLVDFALKSLYHAANRIRSRIGESAQTQQETKK